MEQTLIIVKPDAVQRGLTGEVLARLERRGLTIAALKLVRVDRELAHRHYAEHQGKPFFDGLVQFITSGPAVAGVIQGSNAIQVVRTTMGATNPVAAAPGTIRGDLALDLDRNIIHGSDSPESAAREIALFFQPSELVGAATER
ncbi:MAG: nucleoside-diphosphate kinase [Chloroflexota bacterium]